MLYIYTIPIEKGPREKVNMWTCIYHIFPEKNTQLEWSSSKLQCNSKSIRVAKR